MAGLANGFRVKARMAPKLGGRNRFRICQKAGLSPGEVLRQRMGRTLKVHGPAVVKQGVKDGVWAVVSSFW